MRTSLARVHRAPTSHSPSPRAIPPAGSGHRLPLPAGLSVLLALVFALFTAAAPSQAHDELVDAAPSSGEQLSTPPEEVVLTYSAEIMDIGNAVQVTDSQGRTVSVGDVQVEGRKLTQPVEISDQDGTYTVTWRAVSSDGHPIDGRYEFTVGSGASGSDAASASGAASTSSAASASEAAEASSSSAVDVEQQAAASKEGINPLVWVLLGVGALTLVILAVLYITRRRASNGHAENRSERRG